MQKSGEYYLKEGKLELSILDDAEDEMQEFESSRSYTYNRLSMQQPRRRNGLRKTPTGHQKLKVSKEVYNTLHAMGQFLTQKEGNDLDDDTEPKDQLEINQAIDTEELEDERANTNKEPMCGRLQEVVELEQSLGKQPWFREETMVIEKEPILKQREIDHLLQPYFKDREKSLCDDDLLKQLKIHIQKKIEAIRNDI